MIAGERSQIARPHVFISEVLRLARHSRWNRRLRHALSIALAVFVLAAGAGVASAQQGTAQLRAFPSAAVADGRSTITVSAEIRDSSGRIVPDGTQVVFESSLGQFRESIVRTQNGFAQATLNVGSIAGYAKIRVKVLGFNIADSTDVELVTSREQLSSATEYIEVTARDYLLYSPEARVIAATGTEKGAFVRYRNIEIWADDLQYNVLTYELRARNARVKMGDVDNEFSEVFLRMNRREGFGVTTYVGEGVSITRADYIAIPEIIETERVGVVDISLTGIEPRQEAVDQRLLRFRDLGESLSEVEARKATVFPGKHIQFERVGVKVAGTTVLRPTLFQIGLSQRSPLITEEFFNVTGNNVTVDYPHYLSLGPGNSSLLRFRYGNPYSTGVGASGGAYVDYEYRWNQGDEMEGELVLSGLARNDWGAHVRQYWQADPDTTVTAQLHFPAHRSMFGSAAVNRNFDGFQANFSANYGRSLRDTFFSNEQYQLVVENTPAQVGNLPAQYSIGLTASQNRFAAPGVSRFQQGVGLRGRVWTSPLRLGSIGTLHGSYQISQLSGYNVESGLSHTASLSLSTSLANGLYLSTTFDYVDDAFSADVLGRHRLTSEAFFSSGGWNLYGFVSQSLDVDRISMNLNAEYRFSPLWRLQTRYYMDRYQADVFNESSVILAYRLGFREVGLSYTPKNNRIGLELLGTRF